MKKTAIAVAAICLCGVVSAQEVKIKKGKVTMDVEYYNELLSKESQLEQMMQENALLKQQLTEAQEAITTPLVTFTDSASYAIGQDMFNNWSGAQLGINGRAAAQGMKDAATNRYALSREQTVALLQQFQRNFEERQRQQKPQHLESNIKAGKEFMTQNANNKSVHTTPSGLQYQRLSVGKGPKPKVGDHVVVHYTGTLINGEKFDSSIDRNQPFEFDLGRGQVIAGWDEGIQLMEKGSKYRLVIPYNLGYGEREIGSIPAGSTLIFEVELIDFTSPKK